MKEDGEIQNAIHFMRIHPRLVSLIFLCATLSAAFTSLFSKTGTPITDFISLIFQLALAFVSILLAVGIFIAGIGREGRLRQQTSITELYALLKKYRNHIRNIYDQVRSMADSERISRGISSDIYTDIIAMLSIACVDDGEFIEHLAFDSGDSGVIPYQVRNRIQQITSDPMDLR